MPRVLYVSPYLINEEQVVALIRDHGHQVAAVMTAQDALTELDVFKPDIVVMNPKIIVVEPGQPINEPELDSNGLSQQTCGLRMLLLAAKKRLRVPPTVLFTLYPLDGLIHKSIVEDAKTLMPSNVPYEFIDLPSDLKQLNDEVIPRMLANAS